MKDRGLLLMCLVVAGALYLLQRPDNYVSQHPPQVTADRIDLKQLVAPERPKQKSPPQAPLRTALQEQPETTGDIQTFAGNLTASTSMFVGASTLNVRVAPGVGQLSAGQLPKGSEVLVLEIREGWARIRSRDGKLKGWVSSNFLQKQRPSATRTSPILRQPRPIQAAPTPKNKTINRAAVVQEIIASSVQTYPGRCPCPYNVMRNGRRCGGNSAYSRPGGRSPLCYPKDVSSQMVEAWVARQ